MGRKSRVALSLAVVTLVVCGALAAYIVKSPTQGTQAITILTPVSETVSPPAEAPPTTTSSVAPKPPAPPHDFVAQAMPTSFSIVCGADTVIPAQSMTTTYQKEVNEYTIGTTKRIEYILDIPGDTIALVQDEQAPWASLPGSGAGTVSVWGHASERPMVFNAIALYAGDPSNCKAIVEMPSGVLIYRFVAPHFITPKRDSFDWSKEMSNRTDDNGEPLKGRLLAVTCFDATTEVAWEFALESSQAR